MFIFFSTFENILSVIHLEECLQCTRKHMLRFCIAKCGYDQGNIKLNIPTVYVLCADIGSFDGSVITKDCILM